MSEKIRVLIADDHAIVRRGIHSLLELEPDIVVVDEAENGQQAIDKALEKQPDVVLMDLVMPDIDGIEATRRITTANANIRVLVLTSFGTDEKVLPALKAGALGYLLKIAEPDEVVSAIRRIHSGESWLHPAVARMLLSEIAEPEHPHSDEVDPLTQREMGVLQLVAQGCSNREIADRLFISEATVRTHVSNILSKLHLASRTQAALYALREGYASLSDTGTNS